MFFPFCLFLYACFLLVTFSHHLYLMACLFITCLHTHLFVHCLHVRCLCVCHLPMSFVRCSLFVVYVCHLCCLLIACLRHLFVTYLHHLFTYMLLVKVPTKLVTCSSPPSLFIASFRVVLPPYLYVQV